MNPKTRLLAALPLFAATSVFAAGNLDLSRLVPVPDDAPIPVLDFIRPAYLRDLKLNPAGTHIAAIVTGSEEHSLLLVYDLGAQKQEMLSSRGDTDIVWANWLGDRRVIYSISTKKIAGIGLFATEIGAIFDTHPLIQYVGSSLIAIPPKDRKHPLVSLGADNINTGHYGDIVSLNSDVITGKIVDFSVTGYSQQQLDETKESNTRHMADHYPVLKTDHGFNLRYMADRDGKLAFGITSQDGVETLHKLVGGNWEDCPENLDEIQILGSGDHPGEIVVLGPRQDGKPRALELMDAASGKVNEVLVQDPAYDFSGQVYRDPLSQAIVGAVYMRDGPRVVWFTDAYRKLQKVVDRSFPGQIVRIIDSDEVGKTVLISTSNDRQPDTYRAVDLQTLKATLIGNSAPWLDSKRMRPMNVLKFKTRDGRRLDAYLTLPAGASKQNPPPMVVLPPDAPTGRSSWRFYSPAQFFASRGYAVLQPNYRDSSGYTWMFPTEDEWAFGKMQEDVSDATKAVVSLGVVDRDRVAIIGTAFGGYAALSGVAFEPNLYRCAVAISAVADWGSLIEDQKYFKNSNASYSRLTRKLGDPGKEQEKFDAISPLRHASQIRAAVLNVTCEYDPSVIGRDTGRLLSIVESNHVPTESMSFLNEADGVNHLANQVELYTRIEAFLAKYMAPTGTARAL